MKRFNAQEALEYGLIDRVVRPPRIKADAPRKDAGAGLGQFLCCLYFGLADSRQTVQNVAKLFVYLHNELFCQKLMHKIIFGDLK